jgi:hypothetical protein
MERNEILKKILEEEDYIRCPKFSNSLNKFTEKNESSENPTIARLLMMSEEEVERVYQEAVQQLREDMEDDY